MMALQANPGPQQERQNRKLLEQLEEQKKRLRGGHSSSSGSSTATINTSAAVAGGSAGMPSPLVPPAGIPTVMSTASTLPPDSAAMTPQQRAALQHAHANSVGYFITQDSSFGNLILPVLPRYSDK